MRPRRLFELLDYQLAEYRQAVCVSEKRAGNWYSLSTPELVAQANRVSLGMLALGLKPGDKIAIASENRIAWNLIDLGALQLGVIVVPIYTSLSEREYLHILKHAAIRWVFVSQADLYEKVKNLRPELPGLEAVFSFDLLPGVRYWEEILEAGEDHSVGTLMPYKQAIEPDQLATIIYTSGTSGPAKGVMLSHQNLLSNIESVIQLLPIDHSHRALSFLPLTHIFERMVFFLYLYLGVSIYYAESLERILPNAREVKPHIFTVVPRLLEKLYEGFLAYGDRLKGRRKKAYFKAIELGLQYQIDVDQGNRYQLKLGLARVRVFQKWQQALGGNMLGIVCGAAALPPYLTKVFSAAGIPVREGYGQTEAAPVISFNTFSPGGAKEGTVGMPIPGVEVKIAADGEICARGPNIMMGYYQDPEGTAKAIDAEGWLHTGDVGKLAGGRFLRITDRIKELFKTSGGKYVAPQPIEEIYRASPFIDQIMVVGAERKFVAALIVPFFPHLETWAREQGLNWQDHADLIRFPAVIERYQSICEQFNPRFNQIEKIKRFRLITEPWSVAGGELTPTQKLKRRVVLEKHRAEIDQLYSIAESDTA